MGAIRPLNLRAIPFSGQATSTTLCLGANGGSFVSGTASDNKYVPGMDADAVAVTWEIINTDTANNLYVRFGPVGSSFTAETTQTCANYIILKPGVSYNFPVFDKSQQINDKKGGVDYSVLLVQSSSSTCDFSGMVTVWDLSDEP